MSNLIYIINNNLNSSFCNNLINIFNEKESQNKTYFSRITKNVISKNIRNSTSICINDIPEIYYNTLTKKLKEAFELYLLHIKKYNINLQWINNKNLKIVETYMNLNKYIKNIGFYTFHNDSNIPWENRIVNGRIVNGFRFLTFIWYLNDVNEGGQTEFIDGTKITATQGKLLLFPSNWTYVHKGNIPISSDKYIIVGWLELYS